MEHEMLDEEENECVTDITDRYFAISGNHGCVIVLAKSGSTVHVHAAEEADEENEVE